MRESEIAHRVALSHVLATEIVADEGEYSVINDRSILKIIARKYGYRLDPMIIRSTLGDSWTMESKKDFLEINVHFDKKGRLSVYALPMDDFSQEAIAEIEDIKLDGNVPYDMKKLSAAIKKVRAEALKGELVEHLRLESQL